MSRYIDADALIAQMEADAEHIEEPIATMFAYAAINDVKHAPTIEPERKKGKWIVGANHGLMVHTLTCDQCNHSEVSSSVPNFCPNCGADMRGEEK